MLYEKNKGKCSEELFENPTSEYRGTPFWAWNCELTPELLEKEIDDMKAMGFGGFHMHSRVGMATEYLSDGFMNLVKTCTEKARREKMLAWLYDEDKWPSGFAGGYVTKDIENRQKMLYITSSPFNDGTLTQKSDIENAEDDVPKDKYRLLAVFDVIFDENRCLKAYHRIKPGDAADGEKWFAYIKYASPDPWYNNQTYCDTLSKKTITDFVKITHERYKSCVGKDFGGLVPAIFTDEPQFARKKTLDFAGDRKPVVLPYTTDFEETYKAAYGESLEDHIPELVWELPDGAVSVKRYRYHDHISERFASAFADTIGEWCEKNNILSTGHMMEEPTLRSQTAALGDCMRSYRGFSLPGIDMLADKRELTTAKQAQSAAHQYGREGVLSELYGVTNWTFDFRGHKLQGDWQAALGVSVRVPHLFWVSMRGEAKRDYPASIGYQSPWYKEYKYVEDHFARTNTVMTRGTPDVKIAVIHPVESYWLHFGSADKTGLVRDDMEKRFTEITEWLLYGNLDFDFVCESLLPSQFDKNGKDFAVGKMNYKTVIVPYCETIRKTTLDALRTFSEKGGEVIFAGEAPKYIDAVPSGEGKALAGKCRVIPWCRSELYGLLEKYRSIDIRTAGGDIPGNLIYQARRDGEESYVFIAHVNKPRNYDVCGTETYRISFKGDFRVTEYDTLSGKIRPIPAEYSDGKTIIDWVCGACSSLLLGLKAGRNEKKAEAAKKKYTSETLSHYVGYELSEPNVLLLDYPEYSLNGGEKQGKTNILAVDDDVRRTLGITLRSSHMPQPWIVPYDRNPKDKVRLYYEICSEIEIDGCHLALESYEYARLFLNGAEVDVKPDGYYVDEESIKTVPLPTIKKGINKLEIEYRFGAVTQLEACYLLGNFGVALAGEHTKLVPIAEKLGYDSITDQTLPFYGGNVSYITDFDVKERGRKSILINKYRGSLISVELDGKRVGVIAYPPYILPLGEPECGKHTLRITLFGNRMNTFGAIHNVDDNMPYCSPRAWREGATFETHEYFTYETGILRAPVIISESEQ